MNLENASKTKKLALGILFDAIGYLSFIIPIFDIVWAPAAAYLMTKMYKGKAGKIAGAITFIEEALPMLDVIPTFTLMWLYSYVFKSKKETIIEIDPN
ncbi:MAG: hypothetical protein KJO41_10775 [Bacteroidia bacterium]|nr:hypothetical protein [Bacteroidia bacterium]NND25591.1 hypothetical protein [Flavobacteriaceae bacterium]MBT8279477.1 hypothetical protein [Bacteroidia bacterium]NNK60205.1 hypothetical protein [Flavobacteriaceae bacterium]NNL32999.1 hypothetical protein [Flavobacteriaceae bacterium]